MMWPEFQNVAQMAVARILNTLPEGSLIALCAWTILRLLPRQNSGTRFVVWFVQCRFDHNLRGKLVICVA